MVQGHEPERGVERRVHDRELEPVALGDPGPVAEGGAAQWVHSDPQSRRADRLQINSTCQRRDVRLDQIFLVSARCRASRRERHPSDPGIARAQQRVRPVLDPSCHIRIRRSAGRRVVLEPAVRRRIVRRGNHDPVGQPGRATGVVAEDGVGDGGCGGVAVIPLDDDRHAVGREHLERRPFRGARHGMRVLAEEERPGDPAGDAVLADRLADGQDV